MSSTRTIADVESLVEGVADLWAHADIVFDPVNVLDVEMPGDVLAEIALSGRTDAFFDLVNSGFAIEQPGAINGFFVSEAGRRRAGSGPILSIRSERQRSRDLHPRTQLNDEIQIVRFRS